MRGGSGAKSHLKERAAGELKEFLIITVYLYLCFAAIIYLKAAVLQAHDIAYAPFGIAIAKALICAKFVLVGRMFHLGERFKSLPLIWPTLHKSIAFLVFLLLLNALEEVLVGLIHHRGMAETVGGLYGGTLDQLIATSLVGLLILFPFFAFQSLGELLGERNLVRVFFLPRNSIAAAGEY
jgi:hypothetical protein